MSLVPADNYALAESFDSQGSGSNGPRREANLLAVAWRGRWLILLFAIVGGVAGWALLQRAVPRYTSASRIFVERSLPQLLNEQSSMAYSGAAYLFTQAELIRSASVLAIAAEAPENAQLESFRDIDNRVGFLKGVVQVAVGAQDEIIRIWAELPNPEEAAQIVNSVVDAYISKYAEDRTSSAVEVLTILREEKQRYDAELDARRTAVDEFRELHPELSVQVADGNVVTLRFAGLSEELNSTEIELLQAKALYTRVQKMYDSPVQRPHLLEMAGSQQQAMRDVELERSVKQTEQQLVAERARWGEGHPRVRLLAESLTTLKDELAKKQIAFIDGYVEATRQNYELLDHKRNELQAAYDRQFQAASRVSSLVVQLASLQEALSRTEKMCDILDERIKEVNLSEKVGAMQVSILETANVSEMPTYPNRNRFLAMGVIAGVFGGFGLGWLREMFDHRLRSVDEVAETLQLPVLGVLPHFAAVRDRAHLGRLVADAPRCGTAEAMRTLRTALHFGLAGHDSKTLAITSPSPGDGKSTLASNLAIAMAQADQKVLLIDADMRRPTQHLIFEISPRHGLASVLTERRPVEEAIVPTGIDSLDLLPCGSVPGNPVELLNNGCFAELIDQLKSKYDKIIIDSPPIMPVADARIICAIADSTLLVLRAERSTRRASIGARNELWRVNAKRLGVAVNGVPMRKQSYYGYGDGYGYGPYSDREADEAARVPQSRKKKSRSLPAPQAAQAAAGDGL